MYPSKFEVVLTYKDVKTTSFKQFDDAQNCPLAKFVKKEFKTSHVTVGLVSISIGYDNTYWLDEPFDFETFKDLKKGVITEFRSIAKKSKP